ncbi:hypothetical protein [Gordonia caeni]|uniref:Uncharacterized protein n=1 Tax=Gordonia caeni TaxID=1007097 RepID=A0ABP7PHJ5_9ACTN
MSVAAQLEAIGARARADLAAARRTYAQRTSPARRTSDREPESLPRLMVPVQLDRVGPCSGRRRS